MDNSTENYYNNYFDMFSSEGWKQLIKEFQSNVERINNLETTKDETDLNFKKGQLFVLASLLNLETTIDSTYKSAKEQEEEAA